MSGIAHNTCQVHASLDEKVTGLDFNADIYEDSYNTFIAFLDEIRTQKLPAYHRLMSDLYQLVSYVLFFISHLLLLINFQEQEHNSHSQYITECHVAS
jgi:hypothetical protein